MSNPQKQKGSAFERLAVDLLNELIKDADFKRVPGSGAIGTSLGEPLLTADIVGSVPSIPKKFRIECKVGYNPSTDKEVKSFSLKKEWLDKVKKEANASYSFPFLMGKFSGARDGVKVFVTMDVEEFATLINHITKLQNQLNLEEES
jgi:hypothetical protein